ncbi:MAG: hypothetical protein A2Y94_01020 [Caldithrix sp. RBG_13_44_9]|nr:MAG: hypothetical protein A2Y94_01020 [Caldithrix sp. RBG_13_44_9]
MKTVGMIMIVVTLFCQLAAEELIKKDLMPFFDNVPPPPATAQEAFTKITINDAGTIRISAEKVYGSLEKEVKEMETALAQQMKSASMAAAPPGAPAGTGNQMPDPEMKKKMQQMSADEKMKMAMEMMKSMPAGYMTQQPESPPIQNALAEWQKVYNTLGTEYQQSVDWQQEDIRIDEENKKAHGAIGKWESAEIEKLPQISSGEMSAPDPAKVKEVKLQANDRHIAQANQNLKQIGELWKKISDHKKTLYTPFYQKLVAADYASGYKNFSTFKVLSDAQMMVIKDISHLIETSRNACEESAQWLGERQEIEKQ